MMAWQNEEVEIYYWNSMVSLVVEKNNFYTDGQNVSYLMDNDTLAEVFPEMECQQFQLDKESQRAKSLAFFMLPGVLSLKLSASGLTRTDLEKKATEQTPELITSIFVKMQ